MADWTPWQIVALVAVLAVLVLGIAALVAWHYLSKRAHEFSDLSPADRTARRLGAVIGQCGGELKADVADEVLAIFARSSGEQRRMLVAAISGLFASATDGPQNLPDLNNLMLAITRRLGNAGTGPERPSEK